MVKIQEVEQQIVSHYEVYDQAAQRLGFTDSLSGRT